MCACTCVRRGCTSTEGVPVRGVGVGVCVCVHALIHRLAVDNLVLSVSAVSIIPSVCECACTGVCVYVCVCVCDHSKLDTKALEPQVTAVDVVVLSRIKKSSVGEPCFICPTLFVV